MNEIVKILPYTIDLEETVKKTELHTLFVVGDKQAHRFELEIKIGSNSVNLAGCTVTGYFTNFKENTTIEVVGKAEGSKAIVTLSKPCYTLHGQFALIIQIKSGDAEASVFCGEGFMRAGKAEKIVYEDYVIYDVDTLLAQIAEMKTATKDAKDAAEAANAAAEHAPYINAGNKHWMAWNKDAGKYVDTGVTATGPKGDTGSTPYIGSNGNWWIGSTDTGTKAQGPAGQNGTGSGTVTGVEVNGQKHEPDGTGLVKLPQMGGSDVQIDPTFSQEGKAADAKLTGEVLSSLTEQKANKAGWTANKFLGTDANGNMVVKDAPESGANPLTIYPVGSIYMSVNSTSPASLFGGTWEQLKDRFLLGASGSYAAGNTGGAATVTIKNSNMPYWSLYMGQASTDGEWSVGKWADYSVKAGDTIPKYYGADSGGSSSPLNNMPPYLAVYMWKRVS